MIYSLHLRETGLLVGALLIAVHLIALINAREIRKLLGAFPRSRPAGAALLTVAGLWAFALMWSMDLGEFSSYRTLFLGGIVLAYFLTLKFVGEFLAVRALGMLLLLAAEPLLEAAFQRPEPSRLLLTVLAYLWIVMGLVWVGVPYKLRNQIEAVTKTGLCWNIAAGIGMLYGAAVLGCAMMLWR